MNSQQQQQPLSTIMHELQQSNHQYQEGSGIVSVALLFFLLLLCCALICVPAQLRKCCWRRRTSTEDQHQLDSRNRAIRDHEPRHRIVLQLRQQQHSNRRLSFEEEVVAMQQEAMEAAEAAMLRHALQQRLMGRVGFDAAAGAAGMRFAMNDDEPSLLNESRRDYIRNVLMTKRVHLPPGKSIKDTIDMNKDTSLQQQMSRTPAILNTTHDAAAAGSGGEEEEEEEGGTCIEECPICLCAFEENDEIAWSHNRTCRHLFHRQCIEKWLLNHEECPCCRSLFLFFVNNDDMNDNSNTNNSDGEGPNGRQPSLSRPSSLPIISIADSSMNRDADESSRGDESNRNFARGMDLFYRFASSRRHQASTSSILTAHASTSGTRISPDHHDAEMTLPHLPSINATPPQTFASGALGGNLESWSSSPVRHDELALSSSSMGEITIGTNMDDADDTDLECGTARPPVLSIESVNDSSPSDNVASSVKEGPAC